MAKSSTMSIDPVFAAFSAMRRACFSVYFSMSAIEFRSMMGSSASSFLPTNSGATMLRSLLCCSPSYSISVGPKTAPMPSAFGCAE